eukprot:6881707-Prymnesium_polylepis.2
MTFIPCDTKNACCSPYALYRTLTSTKLAVPNVMSRSSTKQSWSPATRRGRVAGSSCSRYDASSSILGAGPFCSDSVSIRHHVARR